MDIQCVCFVLFLRSIQIFVKSQNQTLLAQPCLSAPVWSDLTVMFGKRKCVLWRYSHFMILK